jgi:hypothetical protein
MQAGRNAEKQAAGRNGMQADDRQEHSRRAGSYFLKIKKEMYYFKWRP